MERKNGREHCKIILKPEREVAVRALLKERGGADSAALPTRCGPRK